MSIESPPSVRRETVAGPRLILDDHHLDVEDACFALRTCEIEDDPRELVARYRAFERGLLAHIQTEDDYVLPAYDPVDPIDTARIRAEHALLREQLVSLGVEVELHVIGPATIERFVETLRAHARHEEHHLYPWAQANLPDHAQREIMARIGQSLHELTLARLARRRVPHG